MAKKFPLSLWKNLAQVYVRDDLMLKATDGMKKGLVSSSSSSRVSPVLISIEKPFKKEGIRSVTSEKTMWGTIKRMEEKMAARAPVTIPAAEFVSRVILGLRRVDDYVPKEHIKMMNRAKQRGDELVEWASKSGIDLTLASWNEELIDIMHKLEDMDADPDAEEVEKIWNMIFEHTDAHMKVVVSLGDDDDDKA